MANNSSALSSTALSGLYGLSDSKISESASLSKKASEVYSLIKGLYISDFSIKDGISTTTYSDGTQVLVNYTESEKTDSAITVPARGWAVIKENTTLLYGGEDQ